MYIKVKAGKGNQHCQHQGWQPQPVFAEIQRRGGCEGSAGMPGREREIRWPRNQKPDGRVHLTGADAGHQRLQNHIAAQHFQQKADRHGRAGLAGFGDQQQHKGKGDPDGAAVSKRRNQRHGRVKKAAAQMSLNKIQNNQFRVHCFFSPAYGPASCSRLPQAKQGAGGSFYS